MYDSVGTTILALDRDTSEDAIAVYTDGHTILVSDGPDGCSNNIPLRKFREIAKTIAEAKESLQLSFDIFLRHAYPRLYYKWAHQKERLQGTKINSALDYIETWEPAALMDNIWTDFGVYLRRMEYQSFPEEWKTESENIPKGSL